MSETPASLEKLLDFFGRAKMEPTAEEVADLLWLAARLPTASIHGVDAAGREAPRHPARAAA